MYHMDFSCSSYTQGRVLTKYQIKFMCDCFPDLLFSLEYAIHDIFANEHFLGKE